MRLAVPGKPHTFAEFAEEAPVALVRLEQQCFDLMLEAWVLQWDGPGQLVLIGGPPAPTGKLIKRMARWYPLGDDGVWVRFRIGISSHPRRPRVRTYDEQLDRLNEHQTLLTIDT